eukprot:2358062-Heterocapsa_arctica.AAC.1
MFDIEPVTPNTTAAQHQSTRLGDAMEGILIDTGARKTSRVTPGCKGWRPYCTGPALVDPPAGTSSATTC